jgi:hypothetical protein
MADETPRWVDGHPNLDPIDDYLGLKAGDRIEVLWTEGSAPIPAEVTKTTVFGAEVRVDPTADPSWSCGPFDMYVTHQCPGGSWAR